MAKPDNDNENRPSSLSSALSILPWHHPISQGNQKHRLRVAPNQTPLRLPSATALAARMKQNHTTLTSNSEMSMPQTASISSHFTDDKISWSDFSDDS
jgi:hypothetical protein